MNRKFLSFVIISFGLSLWGCGQAVTPADQNNISEFNHIIGGEKVLPSSKFADRVLYLALGVKIQKTQNMISLSQTSQCTAFAIAPNIVLTAAHCVQKQLTEEIFVVLSNNPKQDHLDLNKWFQAEKIVIHSRYDETAKLINLADPIYDIAIIKLKKSLPEKHLSLIATQKNLSNPTRLTLAGYGLRTNEETDTSQLLGELFFISKEPESFSIDTDTILINQKDGHGICSGDSGSPAYVFDPIRNEHFVIGILSSYNCEVSPDGQKKVQKKCIGVARHSSIITSDITTWLHDMAIKL